MRSRLRSLHALGLPALLFGALISANAVSFKAPASYPVGTKPVAVAVADFDGDGIPDLAVANSGDTSASDDGNVSILLGKGDGAFQAASGIPVGKNPVAIAAGDLNGDGKSDLVVANHGSDTVSLLLGNGNGTFQAKVDLATGAGPDGLTVADFDADQALDLAVTAHPANVLGVFLGHGDGTFAARVNYAIGNANAAGDRNAVMATDVNGDTHVDLVAAHGGGLSILLGNGDGSFQTATLQSVAFDTTPAFAADFNEDGKSDIVSGARPIIGSGNPSVVFLSGNGDGSFQPSVTIGTGVAFAVADFNGDLKADFADIDAGMLNVGLGDGNGTFQIAGLSAVATAIFGSSADLDGDNAPDIVTVNSDNTVSVLLNTTGADFSISASAPSPATIRPGQSASSSITLTHTNSFENPVELSCSVQPAQNVSCSADPASFKFDSSGSATATLSITSGGAGAMAVALGDNWTALACLLPIVGLARAGIGFASRSSIRGKLMMVIFGPVLVGGLLLQAACGGGGGGGGSGSTSYTVIVSGASGSTRHSTTLTLTVE